jgi:4-carboxymuconolactone decarboxylase
VSEETISSIAKGTAPAGLSGDAALLVTYTKELLQNHKISDETFDSVREKFGMKKTLELTALIGHYLLVGQVLTAFEVDLPDGVKAEIPND